MFGESRFFPVTVLLRHYFYITLEMGPKVYTPQKRPDGAPESRYLGKHVSSE